MKYKVLGNEPEGAEDDIRNPAREEDHIPEKWDEDYEEVLIEKKEKIDGTKITASFKWCITTKISER